MLEGIGRTDACLGVLVQQTAQQVLALLRAAQAHAGFGGADGLEQGVVVAALEGEVAREDELEHDTHGPHVVFGAQGCLGQCFGRELVLGARQIVALSVCADSEAEVDQADGVDHFIAFIFFGFYLDVFEFNVFVSDFLFVNVA